ncbi:MAG: FtsQ-type POTRA domain-containing protein [Desulfobulbaceae bacterium]|nr:FtsQ-type POTRA domain-containing protein [Desulfobulbaceae bacterium]
MNSKNETTNKTDKMKILSSALRVISGAGSALLKICLLIVFVAVISFSFLSLYQYLLSSPYMRLEEVQITGVEEKLRAEIIEIHHLDADKSLLGINLNELKKEIEKHPWIRSVRLERRFPNTLIVDAERQEALGLVVMERMYYMNRYGEIFKEVDGQDSVDLPLITGIAENTVKAPELLKNAVHVMGILKAEAEPLSLSQVSEIHVRNNDEMSLYFNHLKAEVRCKWRHLEGKMDGLRKVSQHLAKTGKMEQINRIDLNYMDGAVVSYKES